MEKSELLIRHDRVKNYLATQCKQPGGYVALLCKVSNFVLASTNLSKLPALSTYNLSSDQTYIFLSKRKIPFFVERLNIFY